MNSYSQKVIEHFKNPHNYGKIKNPSGKGKVGNIICGDVMYLYIDIDSTDGKELIKDIKFETYGCAAAIATSSVITDLAKNKTIKEALAIKKDDVIKTLKGLPPIKIHCSLLAVDALNEAIYDYLSKNKKTIPEDLEKKHDHIKKNVDKTEERYSDWTKAEKK
jgi:nitrogen fixation protein NifU and related proteins